jgi:molecular chaperone GrpE (heat shock protein)
MEKHKGSEPGTIIDELRRGYLWNNELLRPAQVRVAG